MAFGSGLIIWSSGESKRSCMKFIYQALIEIVRDYHAVP